MPQAITQVGDNHLAVLEGGRRSLTILDDEGMMLERRYLWTDTTPVGFVTRGADELGRTIIAGEAGIWVLVGGIGPVFISGDAKPVILGAGAGGESAKAGVVVNAADLTQVSAIAADESGALLIARGGDIFRVGSSLAPVESTVHPDGDESDEPLTLFHVAALAADEEGNIYACDSGTGWVWVITPAGDAAQLAGRGHRLSVPIDPIPAHEAAIDLVHPVLHWDPFRHELLLLANESLYAIDVGWPGAPNPETATIRAIPNTPALAAGVTASSTGLVVSSLSGSIIVLENDSQRVLAARSTGDLEIGRADAVEAVGLSSVAYRDSGQHRWSIYIPGLGGFPWLDSGFPSTPPARLLVGDTHANVYYSTGFDLRHVELNVGFRTLGRRVPDPVFDGQLITEYQLPMIGELRSVGATVWMLDATQNILLRFDSVTGGMDHVAGSLGGGGRANTSFQPQNLGLSLSSPHGLEMAADTLVVIDDIAAQSVVLAINPSEVELSLVGTVVKPGRTALLGGAGDMDYEVGRDFVDLELDEVGGVVSVGESLYLAVDDEVAPPLVAVDSTGVVSDAIWAPESSPDAMALLGPDVLLLGWEDAADVHALNLGDDVRVVLGTDVAARSAARIAQIAGGVRAFAVSNTGGVFVLQPDGGLLDLEAPTTSLAQTPTTSRTVAITADGGLLTVSEGAIWGVDTGGAAELLGEPMPTAPGGVVVSGAEEWISGWPISTLPFGDNLSGLAIAPNGDLFFVDWEIQALFRSEASANGTVMPSSPTFLESQGEPIPPDPYPLAISVDADQRVFLATSSNVFTLHEQSWAVLVGPDVDGVPNVEQKADLELGNISGLEVLGDLLLVRSHEGLYSVQRGGSIEGAYPNLGTPTLDPPLLLNMQSFAVVDAVPVVLIGGEIHRVASWPR